MVDIIKHCNYEAPVNGKTIIHGKFANRLFATAGMNSMTGKFFKIIPNIWVYLEDHPIRMNLKEPGYLLDVNYCDTNEKKSLYLKQLNILFERLNTIPAGQKLLNYLSTYRPLNHLHEKEKVLIHKDNFILDIKTKTLHPANVIIIPPKKNLLNAFTMCVCAQQELKTLDLNKIPLYGLNGTLMFIPEATLGYVVKNKISFEDPAVGLAHELVHALHAILGIYNAMYHFGPHGMVEEFLTFGGPDMNFIQEEIKTTFYSLSDRLKCTADILNSSKDTPYNKNIFAKQFALKGSGSNYTHTPGDEVGVYTKAYIELTERQFVKEFGIPGRKTYKVPFELIKNIDVTDKEYYTPEQGLNYNKIPELRLHDGFIRLLKTYDKMNDSQIEQYYTKVTGWKL